MKQIKPFLIFLTAVILYGCQKAMNSEEIYNKTSSGVVLILNQYYYSVKMPNESEFFFTGISDEGELENFTFDEEEVSTHCSACTGTGFFVSENGLLMTNRHVAKPSFDEETIKAVKKWFKKGMKSIYQDKMSELRQAFYAYEGNAYKQSQIAEIYEAYAASLERIEDMDMEDADFTPHCTIGIAYNGIQIIEKEDFAPCNVIAVSDDKNVDLALIQLDDCTTPENAYVFKLRENDEPLTLDQKLYMIGFNWGFTIAQTEQGIRSQIYSGNVTQKDDGVKILYSIPSLHGSSGSPVVDEYGNLVAVNFAGYDTTQSFNYGIPSKRIRQFLQEY